MENLIWKPVRIATCAAIFLMAAVFTPQARAAGVLGTDINTCDDAHLRAAVSGGGLSTFQPTAVSP